ncbi:MAG: tRNA (guanosine(46)-N7)-methyltransferase TrmB, partial [Planctomycetota bacterium]
PIDWADLFDNANPVEIEIGCGKGTFITQQATTRTDTNFFGLEWARFYYRYTADRLRRNGCSGNARMARAEANWFLTELVPNASVDAVHIYFPDPWPKARHNKRRLIQPAFLEIVERVLVPGGRVQIVTDHQDYWAHIEPTVDASNLRRVDYRNYGSAGAGEVVGTNFERKYIEEGRTFNAIAAVKA